MTPAQKIQDLFRPLIGEMAWDVRCGHGSFLTMEFGQPHIAVRDPVVASPGRSDRVQRNLGRRRVFVVGDWASLDTIFELESFVCRLFC